MTQIKIAQTDSKITEVLELALLALENSEPKMKHYPEPVDRHRLAIETIQSALSASMPEAWKSLTARRTKNVLLDAVDRFEIAEASSHLSAVLAQSIPADDKIIIEHVQEAHRLLISVISAQRGEQ